MEELGSENDSFLEKKVSRRNLLKGALGLAVGAVGADAAYALRVGQATHEITSQVATELDKKAKDLALHITSDQKGLVSFNVGEKVYRSSIDPENIAKSLLYLSFLEGGEEEVENVKSFISKRTLEVNRNSDSLLSKVSEAYVILSDKEFDPIKLELPTRLVYDYFQHLPKPDNDYTIFHELYHIVQQARDPKAMELIQLGRMAAYTSLPIAGGIAMGTNKYQSYVAETKQQTGKMNRRKFLGKFLRVGGCIAAGAVGVPLSFGVIRGIGGWVEPLETQAYAQAGGLAAKSGQLTSNKIFNGIRGKLISYDIVK